MSEGGLLGVLGGMGPESTVYFFSKIVKLTEAKRDQDHIPILIYNYPQIPDRTLAYMGAGDSPLPYLIAGIRKLEDAGSSIIAIPCNSAHLWINELKINARAEILNMIELTVNKFTAGDKVGLLATTLTVNSRLYEEPLKKRGVQVLLPENQDFVMDQIRRIKGGMIEEARRALLPVAYDLIEKGVSHILLGCTEIPLAIGREDIGVPLVDPMEILARECIVKMGGKLRKEYSI